MLMSHGYSCITGSQLCNNHQFLEMFEAELWGQMEAFLVRIYCLNGGYDS
jgi:hypothetical protein